jgi:hypothetical protein
MGLANVQQTVKDSGWRIDEIPWQEEDKVALVYNTPLSAAMALVGAAVFLTPIVLFLMEMAPKWPIVFSPVGLGLILWSRVVAAKAKYRGWVEVDAICVDRDTRRFRKIRGSAAKRRYKTVWKFRLVCEYLHEGEPMQVTPECHGKFWDFSSERQVNQYLAQTIADDGTCRLFVDPDNPRHTVFHRKPWIT